MKLNKLIHYHNQAIAVSQQSPDEQTKVAALLIHPETGAVLGSGFNGFVRGGPDHKLPKTRPDKYEYIIHAEANLIANCASHGIATRGSILYCTLSPCINCARLIYQAAISRVFFKDMYRDFLKNANMADLHLNIKTINKGEFYQLDIKPRD